MCNERADHDRRRCPAEHKRLFDAQVLKRMSGVQEKSQFLSQATHSAILTCMHTLWSPRPRQDPMAATPRLQLGQKVRGRHVG